MEAPRTAAGDLALPAAFAPVGVRGVDASGAVEVVLAADGLPAVIRPLAGWGRAAGARRAGAAVGEAFAAAHHAHVVATASEVAAAAGQLARRPPPRTGLRSADEWRSGQQPPQTVPQSADDWRSVRELLDYSDRVMAGLGSGPSFGVGRSAAATVTIKLAQQASLRCTLDEQWAATVCPAHAEAALGEALGAARRELSTAEAGRASTTEAFGDLAAALIDQLDTLCRTASLGRPR